MGAALNTTDRVTWRLASIYTELKRIQSSQTRPRLIHTKDYDKTPKMFPLKTANSNKLFDHTKNTKYKY